MICIYSIKKRFVLKHYIITIYLFEHQSLPTWRTVSSEMPQDSLSLMVSYPFFFPSKTLHRGKTNLDDMT